MNPKMTQDASSTRDPFGLMRLEQPQLEVDGWPQIRAALRRRRQARRVTAWLTSAALVILTAGTLWQNPRMQTAHEPAQPAALASAPPETMPAGGRDNLDSLVSLSQKLERNLRLIRADVGVIPAQGLIYQVQLEDWVSEVDEAINRHPESLELWSLRVNLLLDMNQLYQQQVRREYPQIASL